MKTQTTNILIIDDHEVIVEGLKIRFRKVLDNVHCYYANNGREALRLVTQYPVDLVICDLNFRNDSTLDGFEIIQKIKTLKPKVKSIAHTSFDSFRIMKKAFKSGFDSFLDKGCSFLDFSQTVKGVMEHGKFTSGTMERLKNKRYEYIKSVFNDSFLGLYNLSNRQIELILNCEKTTNKHKLAEMMHVSPTTIDTHFSRILDKLKLSSRKEIALFAKEFNDELVRLLDY